MQEKDLKELSNYIESQEKKHYESLISLFKWLIGGGSLITAAIIWAIGQNLSDVKKQISDELIVSRQKIADTQKDADDKVKEIREQTQTALTFAQSQMNSQISLIEKEAKNNAVAAARERVQNELEKPQIQEFINSELRKNINNNLDNIADESVKRYIQKSNELIFQVSDINAAYQSTFFNVTDKIRYIDKLTINSTDKNVRDIAKAIKISIQKNYVGWYGFKNKGSFAFLFKEFYTKYKDFNDKDLEIELIKLIQEETDSEILTKSFLALSDLTSGKIELFDFYKVKTEYKRLRTLRAE